MTDRPIREFKALSGYEPLADELAMALWQSQGGKGAERHGNNKPFLQQPLMELARMCGPGGPAQQVMKKTQEALGMFERGETDRAIAELHGAIVYAASTAMLMRERDDTVRTVRGVMTSLEIDGKKYPPES